MITLKIFTQEAIFVRIEAQKRKKILWKKEFIFIPLLITDKSI